MLKYSDWLFFFNLHLSRLAAPVLIFNYFFVIVVSDKVTSAGWMGAFFFLIAWLYQTLNANTERKVNRREEGAPIKLCVAEFTLRDHGRVIIFSITHKHTQIVILAPTVISLAPLTGTYPVCMHPGCIRPPPHTSETFRLKEPFQRKTISQTFRNCFYVMERG